MTLWTQETPSLLFPRGGAAQQYELPEVFAGGNHGEGLSAQRPELGGALAVRHVPPLREHEEHTGRLQEGEEDPSHTHRIE